MVFSVMKSSLLLLSCIQCSSLYSHLERDNFLLSLSRKSFHSSVKALKCEWLESSVLNILNDITSIDKHEEEGKFQNKDSESFTLPQKLLTDRELLNLEEESLKNKKRNELFFIQSSEELDFQEADIFCRQNNFVLPDRLDLINCPFEFPYNALEHWFYDDENFDCSTFDGLVHTVRDCKSMYPVLCFNRKQLEKEYPHTIYQSERF